MRAVVVSESLAARAFPGRDPIGGHIRYGGRSTRPWDVIVGVVGDVKQVSLTGADTNAFYLPLEQSWADNPMWLVVRAQSDAAALAPAIRGAVWSVEKQPIVRLDTMEHRLAMSEVQRRFAMAVFAAFACAALVLAVVGIYGVLSARVTERVREIGLRAALGASPGELLAMILRQGLALAGIGLLVGAVAAIFGSRAIDVLLFGVSRLDATAYVSAATLLMVVSAAACAVPAWRAARTDPAITLQAS